VSAIGLLQLGEEGAGDIRAAGDCARFRWRSRGRASLRRWSSAARFRLPSWAASVERLWYVAQPSGAPAKPGQPARLWAEVLNTGRNSHDANTFVYFRVKGPGQDGYVGRQSLDGLASGASAWKFYDWTIPADAEPGAYSYWAIVWRYVAPTWFAVSPLKGPQPFNVAADADGVARTADPSLRFQMTLTSRALVRRCVTVVDEVPTECDASVW